MAELSASDLRLIYVRQIKIGVVAGAVLHAAVRFAHETNASNLLKMSLISPIYVVLSIVVGSLILIPAFALQAALFHLLTKLRTPPGLVIVLCGSLQAGFVELWRLTIGLEGSLPGEFPLAPVMHVAGFAAGTLTARATFKNLNAPVTTPSDESGHPEKTSPANIAL